ncbi:transposase [Hyphomicrobium sp.]|uniref:IS66-like element accessory protein TnpA n=1 Tax=Hyphomicrobium sp. TaxID=82 RepID=UPI0025B94E93|nr:transposase [Hyphomicrobium sp.]
MSGDRSSRRYDIVAESRGRWSKSEKEAVAAEAAAPDVNVSAIARRHGISPSLLFRWIKIHGPRPGEPAKAAPAFLPVALPSPGVIEPSEPTGHPSKRSGRTCRASSPSDGRIEIELCNGRLLRVGTCVDAVTLKRLIDVLEA